MIVNIDPMKKLINWKAAVLEVRCFRKEGNPFIFKRSVEMIMTVLPRGGIPLMQLFELGT